MPRPRDPRRRGELLDAILDYLVRHGVATLSLRPLAQALGRSLRVLTYHFANRDELIAAALDRLGDRQRDRLRALPGWAEGRGLGEAVRRSWRWQLGPEDLPLTRLLHEIEGLAAGGRLDGEVSRLVTDRLEFVTRAFVARGVPVEVAGRNVTLLNAAYAGLQADYLITGDRERVEAAVEQLAELVETWTTKN